VRIPHELSPEEDDVCLALFQIAVRLLPVKDQPNRADLDFRMCLLDSIRQGNLQTTLYAYIRLPSQIKERDEPETQG